MTSNSSLRISPRDSRFEDPNNMNAPGSSSPQKVSEKMYQQDEERRASSWAPVHSPSLSEDNDPLRAIYGSTDIPFFGSQYGSTSTPVVLERMESLKSSAYDRMTEEVAALNFYEELMHNASPDIQRAASGEVETVWGNGSKNTATVELDFASTSKDTTSHDIWESDEMYDIQYNESTALPRETFGYENAEEIWRTALSVAT